ncbi:MAG TPA: very short patch repair endonuclease [Coriobacteriia bacterium]|nr:MAG: T/G mismatch-specific endonuclease [Actinobacteria bacterium 66_15]HAL29159.1 very short patch repair endonuclease [Coriobacteriia bacterium]
MDNVQKATRSAIMARVPQKGSRPEMVVRRAVHSLGYRYRLHDAGLPGKPDLVFGGRRKVIFVNGCFWHRHPDCALARMPKSRQDFWEPKLSANHDRDIRNEGLLCEMGWEVLTIWECELKDLEALRASLVSFLGDR